jgi:hypothetical protein
MVFQRCEYAPRVQVVDETISLGHPKLTDQFAFSYSIRLVNRSTKPLNSRIGVEDINGPGEDGTTAALEVKHMMTMALTTMRRGIILSVGFIVR